MGNRNCGKQNHEWGGGTGLQDPFLPDSSYIYIHTCIMLLSPTPTSVELPLLVYFLMFLISPRSPLTPTSPPRSLTALLKSAFPSGSAPGNFGQSVIR